MSLRLLEVFENENGQNERDKVHWIKGPITIYKRVVS